MPELPSQPIKVLLIEDNLPDADLIIESLASVDSATFALECVNRLENGLKRIEQKGIDVILLDLALPDSSREVTFSRLQEQAFLLPIIVLSVSDDDTLALEAVRKGAQDYLVKGLVDGKMLARVIRYAIERKKMERLKNEFVSIVSHEMRTPLATIKWSISNLQEGILGTLNEKQLQTLHISYYNIKRIEKIISGLLELSRLESGHAKINKSSINPLPFIKEAIANFRDIAATRNIFVDYKIEGELPDIYGDRDLLLSLLGNLLDNAVRFTKTKVQVRITKTNNGFMCFSICDDGPGIPAGSEGKIFNRFEQVRRPRGSGYKGTGLGLAICKDIVEQHGGKIWVESNQDKGATFLFTIPFSPLKENERALP